MGGLDHFDCGALSGDQELWTLKKFERRLRQSRYGRRSKKLVGRNTTEITSNDGI
jgi:hypothetical protein